MFTPTSDDFDDSFDFRRIFNLKQKIVSESAKIGVNLSDLKKGLS